MKKLSDFLNERCWPGYKPAPGKKAYEKGSCIKEDLRKWFSKTDPAGDWKRINSKGEAIGPCAREPGEPKPKCMSKAKRASLTKKERAAAVRAKRKHDPNPERKGDPINVSNFGKGKISENMENLREKWSQKYKKSIDCNNPKGFSQRAHCQGLKKNEEYQGNNMENLEEKNVPTSPEKWAQAKAQAKAKFDVYPSAYANGWASKKYKEMGGGWKSVSEAKEKSEYDYEGDMARGQLQSIVNNAQRVHDMLKDNDNLPEWVQSKITLAEDYISTVANYLMSEIDEEVEQIDELSTNKLLSYRSKAVETLGKGTKEQEAKRLAGIGRSGEKVKAALKKEEVVQEGRPSQRHPLEGHDYHKKTDAELVHIAKDAHKAAEAMKSHNTDAENKYRDQANDSATVRYFRQKNGMPDWYKKKYGHMKEEVEQIDELSKEKLQQYSSAAAKQNLTSLLKPGAEAKKVAAKRFSGMMKAGEKMATKESVDNANMPSNIGTPAQKSLKPNPKKLESPVYEAKQDVPFEGPYSKAKDTITDKSGAKHGPMSRARSLARQAIQKQKVTQKKTVNESRRMEIVREAMVDAKKKDAVKKVEKKVTTGGNDKFQPDPELSSNITKSA